MVSNSTEGYSGRKEEEEEEWKKVCGPRRGLYFQVTHYCESVIWRLLKQDYSGQTETTRNPQVCVWRVCVCFGLFLLMMFEPHVKPQMCSERWC